MMIAFFGQNREKSVQRATCVSYLLCILPRCFHADVLPASAVTKRRRVLYRDIQNISLHFALRVYKLV